MIATAVKIQSIPQDVVMSNEVTGVAGMLLEQRSIMSDEEFAKALFMYSAHMTALTASLMVDALLSESQMAELLDVIREFDELGKEMK